MDHVIPRAKGGSNAVENLRLAHRRCNSRRGSRVPELLWPEDLLLIEAPPLWPALQRVLRRPRIWETVAMLASAEDAHRARS